MIRIPPIVWARVQFDQRRINITTFAKQLIGKNPPKGSDVDREVVIHFFSWSNKGGSASSLASG